jgi:hypothetical protein
VAKESSKTTQITRSSVRAAEHVEVVKEAAVGAVVAAHSKKEPEAWFLGVVTKAFHKPNVAFWGHRGEKVEEDEWHVQIRKFHAAVGAENQHERIEEDEGLLHVPADCVVLTGVTVVTKDTSKAAAAEAMGEEWNEMPRKEHRELKLSPNTCLPKHERKRIWLNCPK